MTNIHPSTWLKNALLADAAVSGATALLQTLATAGLVSLLGLPAGLLLETGLFMIGYCALLIWLARRARLSVIWIELIVTGNVLWAVGCTIVLLQAKTLATTPLGQAFVIVQAIAVLAFAALEWAGLKRSVRSESAARFA